MSIPSIRFLLVFSAACFFVFAYPVWRLSSWAGDPWSLSWIGILVIWAAGFWGMWFSFGAPRPIIRYLMVHWMGVSFVFATVSLCYEPLRLILPVSDEAAVPWLLLAGAVITLFAIAVSHRIVIHRVEIVSDKLRRPRRIVQISDIHIGSRQGGYMARIVERINRLKPDFVVITGDLIDSSAVGIESLESLQNLSGTSLFSVGNHEFHADLPKVLSMLERLGVIPLRQSSYLADDLQFIGIDDAERKDQVARHLPQVGVREDLFSVLLYHRPVGWESAIGHGVELMLSGHTHNGQIFPFNLLVRQQFRHIRGLFRQGDSHLYVSAGTGTWGPLMRLGSRNEISCFDLRPLPGTGRPPEVGPEPVRESEFR